MWVVCVILCWGTVLVLYECGVSYFVEGLCWFYVSGVCHHLVGDCAGSIWVWCVILCWGTVLVLYECGVSYFVEGLCWFYVSGVCHHLVGDCAGSIWVWYVILCWGTVLVLYECGVSYFVEGLCWFYVSGVCHHLVGDCAGSIWVWCVILCWGTVLVLCECGVSYFVGGLCWFSVSVVCHTLLGDCAGSMWVACVAVCWEDSGWEGRSALSMSVSVISSTLAWLELPGLQGVVLTASGLWPLSTELLFLRRNRGSSIACKSAWFLSTRSGISWGLKQPLMLPLFPKDVDAGLVSLRLLPLPPGDLVFKVRSGLLVSLLRVHCWAPRLTLSWESGLIQHISMWLAGVLLKVPSEPRQSCPRLLKFMSPPVLTSLKAQSTSFVASKKMSSLASLMMSKSWR